MTFDYLIWLFCLLYYSVYSISSSTSIDWCDFDDDVVIDFIDFVDSITCLVWILCRDFDDVTDDVAEVMFMFECCSIKLEAPSLTGNIINVDDERVWEKKLFLRLWERGMRSKSRGDCLFFIGTLFFIYWNFFYL